MVTRTLFVALCAGVWMVGCGSSTDSTGTIADNLKGGQSAQHRSDASDGNENDGGVANGNGNGQGAHVGQGTGDGIDCKPADGGPSPCAQREGLEDAGKDDGSEKGDSSEKGDADKDCKPLDGGPSPCAQGMGRDH